MKANETTTTSAAVRAIAQSGAYAVTLAGRCASGAAMAAIETRRDARSAPGPRQPTLTSWKRNENSSAAHGDERPIGVAAFE